MQDTSTQAMTEVALGLSMAFFALLILALVSMGATNPQLEYQRLAISQMIDKQALLTGKGEQNQKAQEQAQLVFFYQGELFDSNAQRITPNSLAKDKPLTVAIDKSLSIEDALALRTLLQHEQMSVTLMDNAWQQTLGAK